MDKANAIQDEKKRKKAVNNANKIIDRRNQFRDALAGAAAAAQSGNLTASQQAAVSRAVNAYGSERDGNNVIVGFGRQGTGVGATTDGSSLSGEIYVNFSASHHGNDLIIDVAHEGSHVADNQAFNATHSGGIFDYGGPTDIKVIVASTALGCGVRFHLNRPEEEWLASDLDTYAKEAILVLET